VIWDDELAALAVRVRDTFDEDAVIDALARAIRSVAAVSADHVEGEIVSVTEAIAAFKAELRRLLAGH